MFPKKKHYGAVRDCANCGSSEGSIPGIPVHKFCSGCEITFYCSRKCQKAHWKNGDHKQVCLKAENRKASKQPQPKEPPVKGEKCCICLGEMIKEDIIKLDCGHTFHLACIQQLQEKSVQQVCPLCRADSLPDRPRRISSDNYPRLPETNLDWFGYPRPSRPSIITPEEPLRRSNPIYLDERSLALIDWVALSRPSRSSPNDLMERSIARIDWVALSRPSPIHLMERNINRVDWNIFINSSVVVTSRPERDIDEQNIVRGDWGRNGESR